MILKSLLKLRALARESFSPEFGRLDVLAFSLLLLIVFAGPFLYGWSGPGASGRSAALPSDLILELLTDVIAGATLLARTRLRSPGRLAVPFGALIGIAALGTLQILPMPEGILRSLAPVNVRIYHETAQILDLFGRHAPDPRISLAPAATVSTLLLLLACLGLFFAAINLLRNRERRRLFALCFFSTAILQVLLAVVGGHLGPGAPALPAGLGKVAPYLEIALALAFGAVWAEILTNRGRVAAASVSGAERFEARSLPLAGRFLVWALVAFGIAETGSKVGILAAATTTLAVLATAVFHRRVHFPRRRAVGALLGALAALIFFATLAGARPLVRFLESDPVGLNTSAKVTLWRSAYHAWQEFPIFGSGLGAFPEAIRRVQPRELGGRIESARSDPLQVLVTGGAVGSVLAVLTVASFFFLLLKAFRDQRHREESALILGGIGALLSLTIHGLMDSAYPSPAIPAMLACLLGAAWAATSKKAATA